MLKITGINAILEIFAKWLNKRETKEFVPQKKNYEIEDEALTCEHNFMPVDSTNTVLACTKCGFVVKKNENYKG